MSSDSKLFEDTKKIDHGTFKHDYDKSGESTITRVGFVFKSGAEVSISCYDWSKKLTRKNKWQDSLRIGIETKEFKDFLEHAY